MLEASGPSVTSYAKLEHLRNVTFKFKETDRILEGAGIAAGSTTAPTTDQFKRIAAVKFLRHLHMASVRGGQVVWVFSTPKAYSKFPYDELDAVKTSLSSLKSKLDKTEEQFSATTQQRLAEATQLGLAWCEKAKTTLATAKSNAKSMEKIKRWFATSSTTEESLTSVINKLSEGFKKVTNTLNFNKVLITDFPAERNDPSNQYTEAYMLSFSGKSEIPRTIYIEQALFSNFDISVLHDMKKNWARVIVHECTHIDARTQDKGYAYAGIKPGAGITADEAAINADSWSFFAADCGGALVEGDISRALNGTGGTLIKLSANWNK